MKPRKIHLIGIAGAGMRSLADVLLGMHWRVSGSDIAMPDAPSLADSDPRKRQPQIFRTFLGHAAENLAADTHLVVFSSAIPADNPELRRAAELGVPCLSYFEMLGRLMEARHGLAVAGTHGKSTTAAMTAQILVDAGHDPTVVYGAAPLGASSGGRAGNGRTILVEACEYRANFLNLRPRHAVILGIEPDHFDCYDTALALERAFGRFAALLPADGLLLARHDCAVTRRVARETAEQRAGCVETFGFQAEADWSAENLMQCKGRYAFTLCRGGRPVAEVALRVPGRHNVLNALAAAALACANGVSAQQAAAGLGRFRGLRRRLESRGTPGGVAVMDDYAHHPTEVRASLETVRRMFPGRRVYCVFQPHQVSRTARLLDELAAALQQADRVIVADIFRAREGAARPGEITAADLARQARAGGVQVPGLHAAAEIEQYLQTHLAPGDVLVTMGAGDIGRMSHGLVERFRERRAAG